MPLQVSVVIPTLYRNNLLKRCLDALAAQTLAKEEYEIIVADDSAREATRVFVESYSARTNCPFIRYVPVLQNHGPAAARNAGWRTAEAPLIAFTDDDCIPEPDWLERGVRSFKPGVDGVSGRIVVPVSRTPTDHELNTSFLGGSEFATANCFYRKEALSGAGGFDERFTIAWREDADLYFTLLKSGRRLISATDAIVVHPVREVPWGGSIREQSKSMFNALLYKKHPDLYYAKIDNSAVVHYYLIAASSLSFLISTLAGLRSLAVTFFLAWVFFTAALCGKRLQGTSRSPRHLLEMVATSAVIPFLSISWRLAGAVKFRVRFF